MIYILIIVIIILYILNKPYYFTNDNNEKDILLIQKFEKEMEQYYPMGNDYFKISHGSNYYAFFKRIGEINVRLCKEYKTNNIIATGIGVLRSDVPNYSKCWYICDLKVLEKYRNNKIPRSMLLSTLIPSIIKSNSCYGISMNNGKNNRIFNLSKKMPFLNFKNGGNLLIYSLTYHQILDCDALFKKYRGNYNFISLYGIKDLILKSTNQPIKLLHMNFKKNKKNDKIYYTPVKNYTHMLCLHEYYDSELIHKMAKNNIKTNVTATIIYYNMISNWKFIQTDEI